MKKDAAIALIALVVIGAFCYALSVARLDIKPIAPPSVPGAASATAPPPNAHIIIRVNGEPITEEEFEAAYAQLPEQMQQQLVGAQGRAAFGEQLVRLKLLEQEARRLGVDKDPRVAGMVTSDRTNILAQAAAQKIVAPPTDKAVRDFYAGNKGAFESVDLSHILVAYAGGAAPARPGHTAPPEPQAEAKARDILKQLRAGANFQQLARQLSDDGATAERGGELGPVGRGMLPPELEERVFAMKEGETSDPVPSRYGVHIFRVGKRSTQPIDQVRQSIARRMQQQNTLDRVEALRRTAKVDFDPKFFPGPRLPMQPAPKKPS